MTSLHNVNILIQPAVNQAITANKPVVALESTVITHGLPYPQNGELARGLEEDIRSKGCTPATVAILDGMIHVGLEADQLERLSKEKNLRKVSSRDIAPSVAMHQSGGTTVAATLAIAERVGIKVFATGGIGGVHRQAAFDISADLNQLARTPMIVVCAGAKAILDIPATLEVLETFGVPVIGYQTDEFPAFYSVSSGHGVSARADSPEDVIRLASTHWELGFRSAILLAVPPPADVALDGNYIEEIIDNAMAEAQKKAIHGQKVTPFLLQKVSELSGGASLKANLELLHNNARVAAQIALASSSTL